MNKVTSLSIIGGRFIPTSKQTASQSEGCYPPENIGPGGNVSPVLLDYGLGADSRKGVTLKFHPRLNMKLDETPH